MEEASRIALGTSDLHSFLWLWLCFGAAASSHCYHKELCYLKSLCTGLHSTSIIFAPTFAPSLWGPSAADKMLSRGPYHFRLNQKNALCNNFNSERGCRGWTQPITCNSSWIRWCKPRATCEPEMLCWWVNTQRHGPGKTDDLYRDMLGTLESELILPTTCSA